MVGQKILIVYASGTGNIEKLAKAIAEGAPNEADKTKAKEMGRKLAEAAKKKSK